MQKVTLICVGKLKEKFYAQATAEYAKRLSRFCKLEIVELPESRLSAAAWGCLLPSRHRRISGSPCLP